MTLSIYYVYIWGTITEITVIITKLFYYFIISKSVADLIDFLD